MRHRLTPSTPELSHFVSDLTSQLVQTIRRTALEQVEQALGSALGAPARRGPGRPPEAATVKRAAKGGKRDAGSLDEMGATLLAHVKANPGQRGEQIASALGTDVGTMRLPMKKLIAAGSVRTEGQRRGMTYFAGSGKGPGTKKGKPATRAGNRKAGKRGRKARAAGAKAEAAPIAAAA